MLLAMEVPAEPASIPRARHAAAVVAGDHGVNPFDVAIAVSEAVGNAVVHAYRGEDSGTVRLTAFRDRERLCIEVEDSGVGMSPNLERSGLGLGLSLIGAMTSVFEVEDANPGVRLLMCFEAPAEARARSGEASSAAE
jgi:anti-sigma regulatory factor (Ser/Thr protein kinase)